MLAGRYAMQTGADLRQADSRLLFDVAVAYLYEQATMPKEAHDAQTKLEGRLNSLVFAGETGLPPIAMFVAPADATPEQTAQLEAQRQMFTPPAPQDEPAMPPAGMRPGTREGGPRNVLRQDRDPLPGGNGA